MMMIRNIWGGGGGGACAPLAPSWAHHWLYTNFKFEERNFGQVTLVI